MWMLDMYLSNLVSVSLLLIGCSCGESLAGENKDSLCAMFEGHEIGTKNGKPVLATCQMITTSDEYLAAIKLSPFHEFVDAVNFIPAPSFDDFLAMPENIEYRQACRQDSKFQAGEAGSYNCVKLGASFRFFLDAKHCVKKITITIRSESEFGTKFLHDLQNKFMDMPAAVIVQPNKELVQLLWQLSARRLNQIARPGESYRVENGAFVVEATKSQSTPER
jgi:hypothetical protein